MVTDACSPSTGSAPSESGVHSAKSWTCLSPAGSLFGGGESDGGEGKVPESYFSFYLLELPSVQILCAGGNAVHRDDSPDTQGGCIYYCDES